MKTLSLKKLKTKSKIVEHILWDWTPQQTLEIQTSQKLQNLEDLLAFQKRSEESLGYYFYIDVWQGAPHLLLKQQGKMVSEVIACIEEIPDAMLQEAIEEGTHQQSTREYPITESIKVWLKEHLEAE